MQLEAAARAPGEALERFLAGYGRVLEILIIVLMVVLALEVTLGVVFRSLGRSLSWYDEIASVLLAWLTFYGSALASVRRAHISCPELVARAAPHLRRVLRIAAQLLVIAFFALLGWIGASILPILAGDTLVTVPIPMSVVQSVIPVSCVLILVAEVVQLLILLRASADSDPGRPTAAMPDGLH